jgi:hypothetical protein
MTAGGKTATTALPLGAVFRKYYPAKVGKAVTPEKVVDSI